MTKVRVYGLDLEWEKKITSTVMNNMGATERRRSDALSPEGPLIALVELYSTGKHYLFDREAIDLNEVDFKTFNGLERSEPYDTLEGLVQGVREELASLAKNPYGLAIEPEFFVRSDEAYDEINGESALLKTLMGAKLWASGTRGDRAKMKAMIRKTLRRLDDDEISEFERLYASDGSS